MLVDHHGGRFVGNGHDSLQLFMCKQQQAVQGLGTRLAEVACCCVVLASFTVLPTVQILQYAKSFLMQNGAWTSNRTFQAKNFICL